ncbi:conserved Plasmodium protein, unknown function [Plasmodium ovale wallikeri]|uniref:Uncharacterized protein n=2 Tax=Plasmodium ovale TaxID=36330 RepID=A0A1A8YPD0_PLAOA|nr:conserved Plasmodium protein, unknown function [Plasmodium ovale wallikeri]SBT33889.1 conserved Plasmodium protein, unknown function [Plasmodium ovale wallikeri]SBT76366.1 conserved Plasmodium protein, unknown function [Plasmodium ovale]
MDKANGKRRRSIGQMIKEFYINWNYRRQSWRISFYYNCLAIAAAFNIALTLIFQQLIKSFNFFVNYSCEYEHINFILTDLLIFIILTSFISIFAFFLSRICSILSNFTINDFMSLGKWIERIGCTVKWFPWALAILLIFWFIINTFNLITLYASPNLWCKTRLNNVATFVVNNCRLFEGRTAACTSDMIEPSGSKSISYIRKCNDLDYLKNHNYFTFIPDLDDKNYIQCTFNNINICTLYKSLRNSQLMLERAKSLKLQGCVKNPPSEIEDFYDRDIQNSDLYKYSQIFTIGSNVTFFLVMFFFYFVKRTTQFDGLFYQSIDNSDMFILRMLRPLTPWT